MFCSNRMTRSGAKSRDWSIQSRCCCGVLWRLLMLPCVAAWNWLVMASNCSIYPSNLMHGSVALVVCCGVAVKDILRSRRIEKCNGGVLRCVAVCCGVLRCVAVQCNVYLELVYFKLPSCTQYIHARTLLRICIFVHIYALCIYTYTYTHTYMFMCVYTFNVLRCVAECMAARCIWLQYTCSSSCSMLQCAAARCNSRSALQYTCSSHCGVLQCVAVCCSVCSASLLQFVAMHLFLELFLRPLHAIDTLFLEFACVWHMTSSYIRHNWFKCATCRACNMSKKQDSFVPHSFIHATWLIQGHDSFVTHSNVRHAERATCQWDMTHLWLIQMCDLWSVQHVRSWDMTHSTTFVHATWLIQGQDSFATHSNVRRVERATCRTTWRALSEFCLCAITHSYV